jgi:hypothetical protein
MSDLESKAGAASDQQIATLWEELGRAGYDTRWARL